MLLIFDVAFNSMESLCQELDQSELVVNNYLRCLVFQ